MLGGCTYQTHQPATLVERQHCHHHQVDLTRAQTRHDAALQLVDELAALRNDLQTIQEVRRGRIAL